MKTAIIYYSKHHGNTKKLLDAIKKGSTDEITLREALKEKIAHILGEYGCFGFNTFGPFKLIGGIAKNHPDNSEIKNAISFYNNLHK